MRHVPAAFRAFGFVVCIDAILLLASYAAGRQTPNYWFDAAMGTFLVLGLIACSEPDLQLEHQ